jgi:hypothetical protein
LLQSLIGRRDPLNAMVNDRAVLELAVFSTVDGRDPHTDATAELSDPWGRPYFYAYRTVSPWINSGFLLESAGPDGAVHTVLLSGGFLNTDHPANVDNIAFNR